MKNKEQKRKDGNTGKQHTTLVTNGGVTQHMFDTNPVALHSITLFHNYPRKRDTKFNYFSPHVLNTE